MVDRETHKTPLNIVVWNCFLVHYTCFVVRKILEIKVWTSHCHILYFIYAFYLWHLHAFLWLPFFTKQKQFHWKIPHNMLILPDVELRNSWWKSRKITQFIVIFIFFFFLIIFVLGVRRKFFFLKYGKLWHGFMENLLKITIACHLCSEGLFFIE